MSSAFRPVDKAALKRLKRALINSRLEVKRLKFELKEAQTEIAKEHVRGFREGGNLMAREMTNRFRALCGLEPM